MAQETRFHSHVESYQRLKKMVLDASLFNSLYYKAQIKSSGAIHGKNLHSPLHLSVVANEKGALGLPLTTVANFTYFTLSISIILKKIWRA